ncbi:MAG: S8 family serine peptidase [Pseudomonadota bacterium]|nr:S8 family serine peptidase [Pseudomonadota bacterium]
MPIYRFFFITLVLAFQTAHADDKLSQQVVEAFIKSELVRVVVALQSPNLAEFSYSNFDDKSVLLSAIASQRIQVLSKLKTKEFQEKLTFKSIPALVGYASQSGILKLLADPNVLKIDLDVGGKGNLAQSVPLVEADSQHASGVTGAGVVVAVLDSGLDTDHIDLVDHLLGEECFLDTDGLINGSGNCPNGSDRQSGSGAAEDGHGHGTNVTSIISSAGQIAPIGVAPDAEIFSYRVLDDTNSFYFASEIVAALDDIIVNRPEVKVINMSLGTNALFSGYCDTATAWAIAGAAAIFTLRDQGVISFASSGNQSSNGLTSWPACLSEVVSVAATNNGDVLANFSNTSSATDLVAPGVSITGAGLFNGTKTYSGTSQAAPHAAGCAALFISSGVASSPSQVESLLKNSTITVTDTVTGLSYPRIDCFPSFQNVGIDIEASDPMNYVETRSFTDEVNVVVLSDANFGATLIDLTSLRFGPLKATSVNSVANIIDANNDYLDDIEVSFTVFDTGINCEFEDLVEINGIDSGGQLFRGTDSVTTPDCPTSTCH